MQKPTCAAAASSATSGTKAGNLTKKQNVFDDFAAAALLLMKRNYTSSDRLAIMGGSNGGLLMGAALIQHPEMYRAVVSEVGIYDMLRVETTPNGAFNVTEFGSVKDPAQFKALLDYSPYHHVVDGTVYPALAPDYWSARWSRGALDVVQDGGTHAGRQPGRQTGAVTRGVRPGPWLWHLAHVRTRFGS